MSRTSFRFRDFVLDARTRSLFRGEIRIDLEARAFDVLCTLAAHAREVVSREALLEAVWGTAPVDDAALTMAIHRVREALGDPQLIKTVRGVGYMLDASVVSPVRQGSPFAEKLRSLAWIAFEPTQYDPRRGVMPSAESLSADLHALRAAGFDGLITFRSDATLAQTPRLAREAGFAGVVMGTRTDQPGLIEDVTAAAEWVDAYCVGHNEALSDGLVGLLRDVRDQSGRPVTSTWYLSSWADPAARRVADECDWYLLDVGVPWRDAYVPIARQLDVLRRKVRRAAEIAGQREAVVMLKMVSCPSGGLHGYTHAAQRDFYAKVLDEYWSPDYAYPASVFLSFFSAFDLDWKRGDPQYSACERHIGLFDVRRRPKPAVDCFRRSRAYLHHDH